MLADTFAGIPLSSFQSPTKGSLNQNPFHRKLETPERVHESPSGFDVFDCLHQRSLPTRDFSAGFFREARNRADDELVQTAMGKLNEKHRIAKLDAQNRRLFHEEIGSFNVDQLSGAIDDVY